VRRSGRVLVVDDVEDNGDLVAVCLEHAGYETLTASNGLEGVIVAHYALPSVVLMDVTMPVLDGIEHLDVIAQLPNPSFMRVL
jgi:CheY-like chemotaxis protein